MVWYIRLKTLKARLILAVAALVVVAITLPLLFIAYSMEKELKAQATLHLMAIATYVSGEIDRSIENHRIVLQRTARELENAPNPSTALHLPWTGLQEAGVLFPAGVVIVDNAGHRTEQSAIPVPLEERLITPGLLQEAQAKGFAVGAPARNRYNGQAELAMAVPARLHSGKLFYIVGITPLRSSGFLRSFYKTQIGANGELVLVSMRERIFICSSNAQLELQPVPPPGVHRQHDLAMQGIYTTAIDRRAGDHIQELAVTTPIRNAPWFLVVRVPTLKSFEAVQRIRRMISVTLVLTPLLAVVFGILILRRLLRPLSRSAALAHKMSNQEIAYAPLPVERADEVGELTLAFNKLLEGLLLSREGFRELAHSDTLTGLSNRMSFELGFRRYLARARRHGSGLALVYFDLDLFKPVNDRLGHDAGDAVLKIVADRLMQEVRPEDLLARIGGDEFVLLLGDLSDSGKEALEVAHRCRSAVEEAIAWKNEIVVVGLSFGIATWPEDGDTPDAILAAADRAMYENKRQRTECGST